MKTLKIFSIKGKIELKFYVRRKFHSTVPADRIFCENIRTFK